MGQTHAESTPHLAARVWWQVARRDDTRGARRLYRTPPGEGVSRLDAGAGWEEGCHGLPRRGVLVLLAQGPGAAIPRALVRAVPEGVRAGLQTWGGITRRQARPPWWGSDAAVRPWVGGPRGRRQLLEPTRALVMVLAPGASGRWPLAAAAWRVGGQRQAVPPGIGTHPDRLAQERRTTRGSP